MEQPTVPLFDERPTKDQLAAIRAAYDSGTTVLHSRTEIGVLLAEVDRLRAALARITSFCRCEGRDCAATIARAALAAAVSPEGSPQ